DQRRPDQPVAEQVAAAQDVDTGRLGDLGGGLVRHRLVPGRVERVALLAERAEPELRQRVDQLLGHRAERADQVTVLAGPVHVVQYRQQRRQYRGDRLLGDEPAVAV